MNLYEILGVDKEAAVEEIKKAYHNKSKAFHPDKGGDPSKFIAVKNAYEVLTNPEQRRLFDEHGISMADSESQVRNHVVNAFINIVNKWIGIYLNPQMQCPNFSEFFKVDMDNAEKANKEQLDNLQEQLKSLKKLYDHAEVEEGDNLVIRGIRTVENQLYGSINDIQVLMYKNRMIWDEFDRYGFNEMPKEKQTPQNVFVTFASATGGTRSTTY